MDKQKAGAILNRLNLKMTPQRLETIDCLAAEQAFLSADQVWKRLRERCSQIGLPTVYRILDELTEAGVITRIFMADRKQYYFLCSNQEHHHHFVCESCHRVEDVQSCGLEAATHEIARRSGARVTSHIVQVNGICGSCIGKGTAA